jgi:glycerol kinase
MAMIMALDQGTTSSRTVLVNEQGEVVAQSSASLDCHYPHPGWVEQDPNQIWATQQKTMVDVMQQSQVSIEEVVGLGITNQRETTVVWEKVSGEPLAPAIVWQCRRSAAICEQLKTEGKESVIRQRTGLVLDPYFSASKMRWLLNEVSGLSERMKAGEICFGTVDSWLIWKLTAGKIFKTDVTNASRTMLCDLETALWDDELLAMFGIEESALPEIVASSGKLAETENSILGKSLPIAGIAGDQQAALFGQTCFDVGQAKNTYGTGCFLMLNVGLKPVKSKHQLLSTIAWQIGDERTYALEGAVFVAGSLIQWLRDKMEFFEDASETEKMALSVEDSDGCYVVPAFVGLGAPHWDAYATGLIIGLTRNTSKEHIVRAALEAVAYQSAEVLQCMEADLGHPLKELKIDGGASANNFLIQDQADLLGRTVRRPRNTESTALGAAFLAGLATGVWPNVEAIRNCWQEDRKFEGNISEETRKSRMTGWLRAEERSKKWLSEN